MFQMGGPIWHDPIHDPAFVEDMLREGGIGLHTHPDSLPASDAGSNAKETVERSRARMMGVLRSIAAEVSLSLMRTTTCMHMCSWQHCLFVSSVVRIVRCRDV